MALNGEREQWGTKIGLILAVAGNAVFQSRDYTSMRQPLNQ